MPKEPNEPAQIQSSEPSHTTGAEDSGRAQENSSDFDNALDSFAEDKGVDLSLESDTEKVTPEPVEEVKTVEKKEVPNQEVGKDEPKKEQPKTEDDIEKNFPVPEGLSEKGKENFKKIRESYKLSQAELKERTVELENLRKEVSTLQDQVKTSAAIPPQEIEELRAFRSAYDIMSDPQFVSEYFEPLYQNEQAVLASLKGVLSEESYKQVEKHGVTNVPMSTWKELLKQLTADDPLEAQRISSLILKNHELNEKQLKAVQEAPKKAKEYEARKIQEREAKVREENNYSISRLEEIQKQIPWAKEQPIPENATAEQKAEIEAQNAKFKKAEAIFETAYFPKNVQQRFETAIAAVAAVMQAEELAQVTKERDELKAQINKIKGASKITRQSYAPKSSDKTQAEKPKNDWDAIEQGLRSVEGR